MKIYFIHILLLTGVLLLGSCSKVNNKHNGLEQRGGLLYQKGSNKPFTGTEKAVVNNRLLEYGVVNGKKNGLFKISYLNGKPLMTGNIKDNKNEGHWQYYYPDGSIESKGNFKNDKAEGKWVWFYNNGRLREEGNFVNGISQGEWKKFDTLGVLYQKIDFKDGVKIDSIDFNKPKN